MAFIGAKKMARLNENRAAPRARYDLEYIAAAFFSPEKGGAA